MELITSAVQSYQKNQNLAGWVAETEKSALSAETTEQNTREEDTVRIGNSREVYNWIAQTFPAFSESSATLNRVNHTLFEYSLIDLKDIERVNALLSEKPDQPILESLSLSFEQTTSYQDRQAIKHIERVYRNLEAAAELAAA